MAPKRRYKHAVEEYNLCEPEYEEARGQLLRALSKITGRKMTGEAVLMMTRGVPAMLRTREEEKTDE
jgi:hypothetical protein